MAKNRYNFNTPVALHDEKGVLPTAPSNPRVSASRFGAQNVAAHTTVTRESAEMNSNLQGVHDHARNLAVCREVGAGQNFSNSAASKARGAPKTKAHVTAGEGGPVPHPSQVPALPASRNGASYAGSKSQTTAIEPWILIERRLVAQPSQVDAGVDAPQNGVAQTVVGVEVLRVEEEDTVDYEIPDDVRKYVGTERDFYCHVIEEVFYFAALNEPEEPPEPSKKEKCVECCFQAFSCHFLSQWFTGKHSTEPEDEGPKSMMKEYMTPVLRRGQEKGRVVHTNMIFPLVRNTFRNVWVGAQMLLVLIALGLSGASFSNRKNRIFHLVLTILGSVLAIIDGMILFYGRRLFKFCGAACEHDKRESAEILEPLVRPQDSVGTSSSGCRGRCKQCIIFTRTTFDISRIILAELIFYPLVICNIFEVITGKLYMFSKDNTTEKISFILLIVSLGLDLLFVYIVRIVILVAANYHSWKKRGHVVEDRSIRKSALKFQVYFIVHVIAQMVAQILMIIAIGKSIYNDNSCNDGAQSGMIMHNQINKTLFNGIGSGIHDMQNTVENNSSDSKMINISGGLWYMLVAGYVLPICGILSFFIVMYFWVQEFPIGVCVDFLSILKLPGIDDTLKLKATGEELGEKIHKINRYINLAELKKQFKGLQNTAWFDKFIYSFSCPQMVILCLIYTLLQFSFVISVSVGVSCSDNNFSYFYIFAVIFGFVANLYVFIVAFVWLFVLVGLITLTAIVIGLLALIYVAISSFPPLLCCIPIALCALLSKKQ